MKQVLRLSRALAVASLFIFGAHNLAQGQTPSPSPTPDPVVAQITSSSADSFAGGISGNGRLVVIESTGDISTERTATRNNQDGNREIFLYDYAQRRIFQITNTKSSVQPSASPSPTPTPSPSASPTPSPSPTPVPASQIQIEVSNNRPVISNDGRYIIFSSNALTPGDFDAANAPAGYSTDANQELFIYEIPALGAANLSSGADAPFVDLAAGTFTRITNTLASRAPTPGSSTASPFVADDNREATLSDDGSVVTFVSTRDLTGGNADGNPEIFIWVRATNTFFQMTSTQNTTSGNLTVATVNQNPSISGDGSVIAFISNANIPIGGTGNNSDGNAEVYLGSFNGTAAAVTRQVTRTTSTPKGTTSNILSFGKRISRNGRLLAFESTSSDPKNNGAASGTALYVYDIANDALTQIGPRETTIADIRRLPIFTGDNSTLVFSSILNFDATGTVPSTAANGLNPRNRAQLFSVPVASPMPSTSSLTFTLLTNTPAEVNGARLAGYPGNTKERIAFNLDFAELGGGNPDASLETYYLLVRSGADVSPATVSFFTGASNRAVVAASPTPTPAPSPDDVLGLAPGELGIMRSVSPPATPVALAPSSQTAGAASESTRRPPLPVELNGVTVSITNAACGLYSVSPTQINFVVPVGMGQGVHSVVINNNGQVIRTSLNIIAPQPDIFSTTMDAGGRAIIFNVTNPNAQTSEPPDGFPVTSTDASGATVATILGIKVTGLRNASRSSVTVTIGSVTISGNDILCADQTTTTTPCFKTDTPGFEQVDVRLPASLAGAGDVPVIVNGPGGPSRPTATAPHTKIK